MKYLVVDRTNNILRAFKSYSSAYKFKIAMGRLDWSIIEK